MDQVIRINSKESYAELADRNVAISRSLKKSVLEKYKSRVS